MRLLYLLGFVALIAFMSRDWFKGKDEHACPECGRVFACDKVGSRVYQFAMAMLIMFGMAFLLKATGVEVPDIDYSVKGGMVLDDDRR